MSLYLRIVRYLRPHGLYFLLTVGATFAFAGLDAFTYVLLIPFVRALFGGDASGLPGQATGDGAEVAMMNRFLDATIYRLVDFSGDKLEAVQGIIILILITFALKNLFDFLRAWLVARVEQGVTRRRDDRCER